MIKSMLTAVSVIAFLAPAASADTRENFDVEITYNTATLEANATGLERSIVRQARRACAIKTADRIKRIDTVCVDEIVEAALNKINAKVAQASGVTSARLVTKDQTSFQ